MRQCFIFITVELIIIFGGCTTKKHHGFQGELAMVDSLATVMHDSDSAVKLLEQVGDSMLKQNKTTRMAYKLLCIKAYDRARLPYEGEMEIFDILNYYEKNGDKELLPVALYYAGRHSAKIFDTPSALKYYHQAHELIGSDSSNYMNWKISRQIGQLYSQQMLYEESRKHFRDALRYSMISKDTVGAIWNLRDIGGSFQMVGDAVTCDTFLRKALQLAKAKHDTKMVGEIQLCLSDNNIEMGRYDSAMIYLRPVLENKLKNDESPIYTNASRIYYHQGKLDSALYYIGKVLGVGNVYGKRTAYRNRTRIDLIRGDVASAKSDFENYVLYIDSIDHIRASEALANASAAYDYSMKEQENTRLREENQVKSLWTWVLISACVSLFALLFMGYIYYRKRQAEGVVRSLALELALDERKEMIITKQKEIDLLNKDNTTLKHGYRDEVPFLKKIAEVRGHFMKLLEEGTIPKAEDWMMLESSIYELFPNFSNHFPEEMELSYDEKKVCWLSKLKLSNAVVAKLMVKSPQAITSIKSRLYSKITKSKGTSQDFYSIINSI